MTDFNSFLAGRTRTDQDSITLIRPRQARLEVPMDNAMSQPFFSLIYLLFFFSGAAALIYEVVWVRSLSLIFGGTHLAVTTVLAVFMGGLALGSHLLGKRVDRLEKPLRFYGFLELGIAFFAIVFIALMQIYPDVYILLAGGHESAPLYLTFIRVCFAILALIMPTTLMGGTLPVLTRFVSGYSKSPGTRLSLLYGINTLGAVAGTVAAGFVLLRYYSVSITFSVAIAINAAIGLAGILLQDRMAVIHTPAAKETPRQEKALTTDLNLFSSWLVLWGIGISGFCALGYEVLWTRILTLTVGTSVYGFCIMLAAFLTGIALGSQSYGSFRRIFPVPWTETMGLILGFGIVQILIGVCALVVTFYIRDLPTHSITLTDFFQDRGLSVFQARQWAHMSLAFAYMVVPAFFMGLAFPLAGNVNMAFTKKIGHAVGSVLAFNTVGAILGSAVSGFFMIYVFGIERSLQLLTLVNIGLGVLVVVSLRNRKGANLAVIGMTLAALVFLIIKPDVFRMWNARYFAIFQNNQPEMYSTPAKIREAIENTDVLFYKEGIDSTISSIRPKGFNQFLLVNGKIVASSSLKDRQCQMTLGHLPMLLHKNPEKVLVVGLGTGMTLGAVSVHPTVRELTLAEIEPNVVGAARTFAEYNNHVLDDPKLKIVFNDGRNFLLTTNDLFDVITADPIHPWTRGSGYLYTAEYFKLAAEHLLPGGIMCQWLPIYELSVEDLKSVVKTFSRNFRYTMTWLTHYDAEIIGSNSPILINEQELAQRLAFPAIAQNLAPVMMGTADDFLSYFVLGTEGMAAFSAAGRINTDDNLYLEFSTPISLGKNLMGINVEAITRYREAILPYLVPAPDAPAREEQVAKWSANRKAAILTDKAHALFLDGDLGPDFQQLLAGLGREYPSFSPARFIRHEYEDMRLRVPQLLERSSFVFLRGGKRVEIEIAAVIARVSRERAKIAFVDNAAREIFGQRYFSGPDVDKEIGDFSKAVMEDVRAAYQRAFETALEQGRQLPDENSTMARISEVIKQRTKVR